MRKAMILTLLLLILSVGGVCVTAANVYAAHDQVQLTERVSGGDRSAADGLTVRLSSTYENRLRWDTTLPLDSPDGVRTEYRFSARQVPEPYERPRFGIFLYTELGPIYSSLDGNEPLSGVALAYQELAKTVGPGEKKNMEIRLRDYTDYYPLSVMLDFPGSYASFDAVDEAYGWDPEPGTAYYALSKLRDYFKIPVLEETRWEISLGRSQNGAVNHVGSSLSDSSYDSFEMQTISVLTDDACYFTFDPHSANGAVMDTSEIPGGYGIYRLPYAEERHDENGHLVFGVDADGLETVYALDPEIHALYLHTDPEQGKLLLHAVENGKYMLTVIDLATMETLQKLELMDYDCASCSSTIFDEGSFIAVLAQDWEEPTGMAAVIAVNDAGEYEFQYLCGLRADAALYYLAQTALAFDGEKLAISDFLRDSGTSCSFFLEVYDASGLLYYGEFQNSLDTGYDPADYAFHCLPYGSSAIALTWRQQDRPGAS